MALVFQMKLFKIDLYPINLIGSLRRLMVKELTLKQFGEPLDVIELVERELPAIGDNDVLVRMLAAPVNPSDINIIQGKYPIKPRLPNVVGNEGVGIVEEVGTKVTKFCAGQKVIVAKPGQGTWRNFAVYNKDYLRAIPFHMGLVESATLTVNPCTAYRMLTDFKPVREDSSLVVIQNGANSAVGQNVIQLCKVWRIPTVNVVRDRADITELKEYLTCLGATYVFTEEELKQTNIFSNKLINRPVLALNCIGGKNSLNILKHMSPSGVMVTYGGMSRRPVTIPTSAFIFRNLSFCGFWLSAWQTKASVQEKDKMLTVLINLMCENRLRAPAYKIIHFERYKEALGNTLTCKGFTGYKYIMDFSLSY